MSRYQAMLDYLAECPAMAGVLNFQAAQADGNSIQITTEGGDSQNNRRFIDGSIEKRFDFTVAFFKPVISMPYNAAAGTGNANLEGILDVQTLIDWLEGQNAAGRYPDFGDKCQIDSIRSMSNEPVLAWIDGAHYAPPMAKYTVTVRAEYIDFTRAI